LSDEADRAGLAAVPPRSAEIDDFEDLFENAPCGYLSTDKDGRIVRANRTFAQWTDLPSASLVGRRFSDLLPIVGKIFYETHFAPMLHIHGSFSEVALDIVRSDDTKMPVLVNAVERRGDEHRPGFIRFTIFNATERRRYERGLLSARDSAQAKVKAEQDSSELREQFIAVLGHDLRNPLASIAIGIRLLEKEPVSDRGKRVIALMEGSLVRATGLIDNVLDFARGRLGGGLILTRNADEPLEPALRQVVSELTSIAPERNVTADYRLEEPIACDRGRIGQLLSNLLGNALTYGGKDTPVSVSAFTEGNRLEISVANGGVPISPAAMTRLFHPFFRGENKPNREGLGLGLYIASEIAKAHGGALIVSSDRTETRFTFTMPLV
jgi:sigma-B regulation protein RsbU (phosphoserine phosphatase)